MLNKNKKGFPLREDFQRGFSLVELIVIIAILGILVLLAAPKFLGYIEKAELVRIQHDVKVMEGRMDEIAARQSNDWKENYDSWDTNSKNLRELILAKRLYETGGAARALEVSRRYKAINLASTGDVVGGEEVVDTRYKIIPQSLVETTRTKLPGTFYANYDGKIYYEHGKSLTRALVQMKVECLSSTPEEGKYEFEASTGTITKYNGDLQHLIIPASFNVGGVCYPVRVIGRGAFMRGFERVVIPEGVIEVKNGAFDSEEPVTIEEIVFPSSVTEIRDEIFSNHITVGNIIIRNSQSNVAINGIPGSSYSGTIGGSSPSYTGGYSGNGSNKVGSNGLASFGSGGNNGSGSSSSAGGGSTGSKVSYTISNSNKNSTGKGISIKDQTVNSSGVLVIPATIEVAGEEIPVEVVEEAVFQGEGLISVVLPFGLQRIESYAFAGNQLIEVHIPESVEHIGNYAFAFNEVSDGKRYKPTIKSIQMKSNEYFNRLDKEGNITDKVVGVELLNNIFVANSNNHVIEVDKPVAIISGLPNGIITPETKINWGYSKSRGMNGKKITEARWKNKLETYPAGKHIIELEVKDGKGLWSKPTQISFSVIEPPKSPNNIVISSNTIFKEEEIFINWDSVTDWGGNEENKQYRIEYRYDDEGGFVFLANSKTNNYKSLISMSNSAGKIQYRVRAENKATNSAWVNSSFYTINDVRFQVSNVKTYEILEDGTYHIVIQGGTGGRGGDRQNSNGGTTSTGSSGSTGSTYGGLIELKKGNILSITYGVNGRRGSNVRWSHSNMSPRGGNGSPGHETFVALESGEKILSAKGGAGGRGGANSGGSSGLGSNYIKGEYNLSGEFLVDNTKFAIKRVE